MSTAPRLTVELVPATSWGSNLRSVLPRAEWARLSRQVRTAAGMRCEICGGRGQRHAVECHEVWEYDDDHLIQRLVRLIALCPDCHGVKHIGRTTELGFGREAREHLGSVNGWAPSEVVEHLRRALAVHRVRSRHPWTLDLTTLQKYG